MNPKILKMAVMLAAILLPVSSMCLYAANIPLPHRRLNLFSFTTPRAETGLPIQIRTSLTAGWDPH